MEDTLVSFIVAKLAKEKGFDIPVRCWYIDKLHSNRNEFLINYNGINLTSRPSQSLLQKWLRDNHELSIKIDDFYTNGKLRYDYNISKLGSQDDNPQGVFNSYEEALEAGLQKALKLIK